MQVKELMTHAIVTVSPEATVSAAARLLSRHNVGCLPVCGENGALEGMVTDRDIVLRCVAINADPAKTSVRAVMTGRILSVTPDDSAARAAKLMAREQVRRIPVAQDGKIVGMVTLGNLAQTRQFSMETAECLCEICDNVTRR